MCINCGCRMPDDTMGNEANMVLNDIADGAIASGQDGRTTLENIKKTLEMITAEELDKRIEQRSQKS